MSEYVFRQREISAVVADTAEILSGDDGDIVVVSGAPQSGRSTMLLHLARELADEGWIVVRHTVSPDGRLQVPPDGTVRRAGWAVQGLKVAGAATNIIDPVTGGIVALIGELATAAHMRFAEESAEAHGSPHRAMAALADALEQVADKAPLALVIDDADKLDPVEPWWDWVFGQVLPDLTGSHRVLAVLGVDGSKSAAESYARTVLSGWLIGHDVAMEVALAPLTAKDIECALVDVDGTLATELVRFGRGGVGWVHDLLCRWQRDGIVVHDDVLRFAPDGLARAQAMGRNIADAMLLEALPGDHDRARRVLRLGSLEGRAFTAEAVASVTGQAPDALVAWIEDTLRTCDPPLVDAADDLAGMHRYRFASPLLAGTLRDTVLRGTDGPVLARRYAYALFHLYHDRPQFGSAWAISRLAAHAEDEDLTKAAWHAGRRASLADMALRARMFAARLGAPIGDGERFWLTGQLNGLVWPLHIASWRSDETTPLAEAAVRSARMLVGNTGGVIGRDPRVEALARALYTQASIRWWSESAVTAEEIALEAAELYVSMSDNEQATELFRLAADCAWLDPNGRERTVTHLERSLEFARAIPAGSPASIQLARTLATVSRVQSATALYPAAISSLLEATTALTRPEFRRQPTVLGVVISEAVAAAAVICSRIGGDDENTVALYERAVDCVVADDGRSETLLVLGRHLFGTGRHSEAVSSIVRAWSLARGNRHLWAEAVALAELAVCAYNDDVSVASNLLVVADQMARDVDAAQPRTAGRVLRALRAAAADRDSQAEVVRGYAVDGGTSMIEAAFGVDVREIELANAQRTPPTTDEYVEHARAVAAWCRSNLGAAPEPPEPRSGDHDIIVRTR